MVADCNQSVFATRGRNKRLSSAQPEGQSTRAKENLARSKNRVKLCAQCQLVGAMSIFAADEDKNHKKRRRTQPEDNKPMMKCLSTQSPSLYALVPTVFLLQDNGRTMAMRGLLFLCAGLLANSEKTLGDNVEGDYSNSALKDVPQLPQNITKLTLSANFIQLTQKDVEHLSTCTRLSELNLNDNNISAIPAKLFSSLPQLRILKVANNSVSVVEPGVLSGLNKLIQLDLSHNQIRQLPVAVFADLKVLETLNLRGNRLQTLDNRAFEGLTKLQQVTLGDNPWNCSCAFLKMMKTIKSSLPKDTTLSCKSPPERTGKSVVDDSNCVSATTTASPVRRTSSLPLKTNKAEKISNGTVSDKASSSGNGDKGSTSNPALPQPGNSWKFLLGVVVIALSTSVLIVCAVKSPSWYKLLFNYRHQRLQEEDEHNIFTRARISNFSLETQQTETSAQELDGELDIHELDNEDGFIEDRYIEPGDYKDQGDS
ncbi:leucine-rich repeat-containing protein 19-like isoform X2 [Denticeps clupeoides]|uniref:leucine-rich repeat-containing protein 19-like isoform X2 n=1 Tax=Denticeps clupeoides TaxID=299321 RepID=UPI0010A37617|nr:leucine-rich repeat-containing protein 19 isoform X2 [Denticeps clupeoides]